MCWCDLNPFKLNGISHSYQSDQCISVLRVVGKYFFIFIQMLIEHSVSKQWKPDQTPHSAVSDLGLYCLHMSHKKDFRCIWVKN